MQSGLLKLKGASSRLEKKIIRAGNGQERQVPLMQIPGHHILQPPFLVAWFVVREVELLLDRTAK